MRASARNRTPRHRAERRGRIAERLCRWHLRLRGWRIVAADWRCPSGEIDIIARRGRVLAVVEVKSRADLDSAALSLLPRQRRRIARAAAAFLSAHPELAPLTLRFDVMLVAPLRPPRHLVNAWARGRVTILWLDRRRRLRRCSPSACSTEDFRARCSPSV